MQPPVVLHIFRRDLRLEDNTALNAALATARPVLACFCFDPRQTEDHPYRSARGLGFMIEALRDLDAQLQRRNSRLYFFRRRTEEVLARLASSLPIEAVFLNRDYTPFSITRDRAIESVCAAHKFQFHIFGDALLNEPEEVLKDDRKPYTVFTPFFKRAGVRPVKKPAPEQHGIYFSGAVAEEDRSAIEFVAASAIFGERIRGGRTAALKILEEVDGFRAYNEQRDFPALDATTKLSPHNKFGTVSPRETYWSIVKALGAHHPLLRQLYWRDFFSHIGFHFPHVFSGAFHRRLDAVEWSEDRDHFERWCSGTTGFPIVDAGMRELNATGFMHNRVRMVVASFLTKDLHLSWRWGERYFATALVDYDPAVNNGNWQWAASTGCDAQPYFRIFNPWLQQRKFDSECAYIKQWIPELSELSARQIHNLGEEPLFRPASYPEPIVDHAEAKITAEEMFTDLK